MDLESDNAVNKLRSATDFKLSLIRKERVGLEPQKVPTLFISHYIKLYSISESFSFHKEDLKVFISYSYNFISLDDDYLSDDVRRTCYADVLNFFTDSPQV